MPTFTIQFTVSVTTLQYYVICVAAETTCGGEEKVTHISLPWCVQNMEYYEDVRIVGNLARWVGWMPGRSVRVFFFRKGSKTFSRLFKFLFFAHVVGLEFSTNSVCSWVHKLRKKRIWLLIFVCPSISLCPHGTTRFPPGGLSWKLLFEYFSKICRENSNFSKICQE